MPNRPTGRGEYHYACLICGREHVITYPAGRAGALPRYCPPGPGETRSACQRAADNARVRRWRERHPERAQDANQRTVAQRKARKAAEDNS